MNASHPLGIKARRRAFHVFVYAILTFGAAVMLVPFLWTLSTSLKLPSQIFTERIQWLPGERIPVICSESKDCSVQIGDHRVGVQLEKDGFSFEIGQRRYPAVRGQTLNFPVGEETVKVEIDPPPFRQVVSSGRKRPLDLTTVLVGDVPVRIWFHGQPVTVRFQRNEILVTAAGMKAMSVLLNGNREVPSRFLLKPQWVNYVEALTIRPFILPTRDYPYSYLFNTMKITFLNLVFTLFFSSCCAYGFARLRAPGKNLLFGILLSTMMLPPVVTLIPVFIMFRWLRWVDTIKPLVIGSVFGTPFFIFLLRQFFLSIPKDLEDAARIDGASSFEIFWRIMLPLAKPALATVAIFTFMGSWNSFMAPLIYLNSESKWTLQVALASFMGAYGGDMHLMMTVTLVILAPPLVLFLFCQRYFIEGIVTTGLKM